MEVMASPRGTFANLVLTLLGQTFEITGQTISLVGAVFTIYYTSKLGRSVLLFMPRFISRKEEDGKEVSIADNMTTINKGITTYGPIFFKLGGVIGSGITIKVLGLWFQSKPVLQFMTNLTS